MSTPQQELLDHFLDEHRDVPGVLLHLSGPTFRWACAAGVRDASAGDPLDPDTTYRIASITKTYVATAILRLQELGKLDIDEPIGAHISDGPLREMLGEKRCERIRLKHLLSHTSGLPDFVGDTDYPSLIFADLTRRWSREDQVALAMTCEDVGDVGEGFHYSDTGYLLLGEAIERLTGEDLAGSLRSLLRFEELGLNSTYMESLEPAPPDAHPRAHQYSEGVDTYDADPSFDLWGGGGLVSTTSEVAAFFRSIFEGKVFERGETLDLMTTPILEAEGASIGLGIAGRDVGGHRLWGHGGYWGLYAGFIPDLNVALAVAVLERNALPAVATELLPGAMELAVDLASR